MQTLILKRRTAFVAVLFMATLLMQLIAITPAHALQNAATWDGEGSDNKFSTAANWEGDVVPSGGESVYLDTNALTGSVFDNDLAADTSFESIVLVGNGAESSYTLTGNAITLTSAEDSDKLIHGGLINATDQYEYKTFIVSLDITLAADMDFYAGGKLIVGPSDELHLLDLSTFTMTKTGEYPLIINATPTGSGDITIDNGEFIVTKDNLIAITINNGGTLKGNDVTVGDVTVESGGEVAPGMSPGCLTTGDLTFNSGSTLTVEIAGETPCTGYDQTVVAGTVTLGGATLDIPSPQPPAAATAEYIIISNDGADAVVGTFAGLAEGATTTPSGSHELSYKISYVGGDGNDVVLSLVAGTATAPDTGFGSVASNYIFVALVTIALAGAITFTGYKVKNNKA